jgi:hypothetical protein
MALSVAGSRVTLFRHSIFVGIVLIRTRSVDPHKIRRSSQDPSILTRSVDPHKIRRSSQDPSILTRSVDPHKIRRSSQDPLILTRSVDPHKIRRSSLDPSILTRSVDLHQILTRSGYNKKVRTVFTGTRFCASGRVTTKQFFFQNFWSVFKRRYFREDRFAEKMHFI